MYSTLFLYLCLHLFICICNYLYVRYSCAYSYPLLLVLTSVPLFSGCHEDAIIPYKTLLINFILSLSKYVMFQYIR